MGKRKTSVHALSVSSAEAFSGAGYCELLLPAPLAGPVLRAFYCRYHYLGRYVVALAMSPEHRSKAAASLKLATARKSSDAPSSNCAPVARLPGVVAIEIARALGVAIGDQQAEGN